MPGFRFKEKIKGEFYTIKKPQRQGLIYFTLVCEVKSLSQFFRDFNTIIKGEIFLTEVVEKSPLSGRLNLNIFKRRLIYTFEFKDKKGRGYKFYGQKNIKFTPPFEFIKSITNFEAVISREGEEFAKAYLRFDLRQELIPLILSFRLIY
jgi:hypothetical protein